MNEIKIYPYQQKILDILKKGGKLKLILHPQRYSKSDYARAYSEAMKKLGYKEWKPEKAK
jgi:hypothetical protein